MNALALGAATLVASGLIVFAIARRHTTIAYPLAAAFVLRAMAAIVQALTHRLPDSTLDAVTFERTAWEWATDPNGVWGHFAFDANFYTWLLAWVYALLGRSELMAQSFNVLLGTLVVLNVFLTGRELWGERAGRRAAWVATLWPALVLYSAILLREAAYAYLLSLGAFFLARWFRTPGPAWLAAAAAGFGLAGWFHRGAAPALIILGLAAAAGFVRAVWRREFPALARYAGSGIAAALVGLLLVAPLAGVDPLELLGEDVAPCVEGHCDGAADTDTTTSDTSQQVPSSINEAPPPAIEDGSSPSGSEDPPSSIGAGPSPAVDDQPPPSSATPTPAECMSGSCRDAIEPVDPDPVPAEASNTPTAIPTASSILPPAVLTPNELSPDVLAARQQASADARSAYLTWLPQRSLYDVAWQAPLRAFYFLFSPMPWSVELLKDVVGMFEGLLYLLVVALLWRGRRELRASPAAIALLAIVALLILVYASNTFNAGTALRHRAKFAPILIALVPVLPWPTMRHHGSRTRILHVVNAPGSFLQNRLPAALHARRRGYEVEVAGPSGPEVERIRDLGFSYHVVPFDRRGTNPMSEARTFLALLKVYRQVRPDVVHHFTIKPVVYGGIAARLARVPACIHTITGLGYVYTSRDVKARALRPFISLAYTFSFDHPRSRVVFQNPDDRALLERAGVALPSRSSLVRGSGVDVVALRPTAEPEGDVVVALPARMLWDKGVGEFVEAARTLRGHGARYVLVGDTDPHNPAAIPRAQLEAWAKEGAVEWWGWRDDMRSVYAQAHVVCLPSYREGVPKVLLEAAACGRALVATDAPGCREVVAHEETGLLVPTRDAAALARALARIVRDADLRRKVGEAARLRVEREFSEVSVAAAYIRIYDELSPGASAA